MQYTKYTAFILIYLIHVNILHSYQNTHLWGPAAVTLSLCILPSLHRTRKTSSGSKYNEEADIMGCREHNITSSVIGCIFADCVMWWRGQMIFSTWIDYFLFESLYFGHWKGYVLWKSLYLFVLFWSRKPFLLSILFHAQIRFNKMFHIVLNSLYFSIFLHLPSLVKLQNDSVFINLFIYIYIYT